MSKNTSDIGNRFRYYYSARGVTLYHADFRDLDSWALADVLVTDPPYGIHHSKHSSNVPAIVGERKTGRSATRVLTTEHVSLRESALGMWGARPALIFGHWRAPRPAGTQIRLVWDKERIGMGGVFPWRPADEEIYVINWPNPKGVGGNRPSVLRYPALRGNARNGHPTPKPVALMETLISSCPPGSIADPFAGSGSTLLAAQRLGRAAVGVEIEERYCEIAARRLDGEPSD